MGCFSLLFLVILNCFPGHCSLDFSICLSRDGEKIFLSSYAQCMEADCECNVSDECISKRVMVDRSSKVTLQLHAGYYHDLSRDLFKVGLVFHLIQRFICLHLVWCSSYLSGTFGRIILLI